MKIEVGAYFSYDNKYYKITKISGGKVSYKCFLKDSPVHVRISCIEGWQKEDLFKTLVEQGKIKEIPKLIGLIKGGT
jgi:hypothetical protein